MAIQACSNTLYQTSIQQALHFYSQAAPVLNDTFQKMDCCKGQWGRDADDLPLSTNTAEQKEQLERKALVDYHTFQKAHQLAQDVFKMLSTTRQACTRKSFLEEDYETMQNLGINIRIIHEHENALKIAVQHLESIEKRIQVVLKGFVEKRLPEVAPPLDRLLSVLHPELVGWGIASLCGGQPALTKTYADWLKNASEEQKTGSLITNVRPLKEFSFGAVDPTFSRLDEALKTLEVTYIDPQTSKGYGILPISEEGWKELEQNVQQQELEQSKQLEEVEQPPIILETQPSFLDLSA